MQKSLKDTVLESTDIVELIGERVALVKKGKDHVGLCPFHDDHKPSMAVSQSKQIFKCWSCGTGGDAIKFVQLRERVDFREALIVLARRAGIDLASADSRAPAGPDRQALRAAMTWARTHFERNLKGLAPGRQAEDYARSRGMSLETIERFGLGFAADSYDDLVNAGRRSGLSTDVLVHSGLAGASDSGRIYDRFRNRLVFPICDSQGRPIAFGGRALGDDPAKYLNSPETALFSKSRVLFAHDRAQAAIAKGKSAIVVEGYLDAILLHQAGFENAVAPLGTALTDAHVKALVADCEQIYMCFDGDEAGVRAADRAVQVAMRHGVDVRVVIMPENMDPADVIVAEGPAAFNSLLQSAIAALEFKWNRTLESFGGAGARVKREAIEAFLGFIGRLADHGGIGLLDQGLAVGRIAEVIGLAPAAVYELLERARLAQGRAQVGKAASSLELERVAEARSEYDGAISGLPVAIVSAAETLFGIAIRTGHLDSRLDAGLSMICGHCVYWNGLLTLLRGITEGSATLNAAAILERTDDPAMCELLGRAIDRARGLSDVDAATAHELARLRTELELLRIDSLQGRLGASRKPDERARALDALIGLSKNTHGPLGALRRVASAPVVKS